MVVGRVDIMEKRHPGGEDSLSKAQRGGNEIHCYPCPWLTLVGAESTHRKKKLEKKTSQPWYLLKEIGGGEFPEEK